MDVKGTNGTIIQFPKEVWQNIFEWDSTYHDWFQAQVLPEMKIAVAKEMAELYFHFFMAPDRFYLKTYHVSGFRYAFHPKFTCRRPVVWYMVEWLHEGDHLVFRVHNEKTGLWFDHTL